MAHSVSEAADRAVKNSQRKPVETRTPDQRLLDIRKNIAAKLFVIPDDVRFLLEAFDAAKATLQDMADGNADLHGTILAQDRTIADLRSQIEQFREVYEQENRSTTLKVERVLEPVATGSGENAD